MSKPRLWTAEEEQLLGLLYGKGEDDAAIGKRLGRTERAVCNRRVILGLVKTRKAPARTGRRYVHRPPPSADLHLRRMENEERTRAAARRVLSDWQPGQPAKY